MDQDKMTFELQSLEGRRIPAAIEEQHRDIVLETFNGFEENGKVLIRGIGKYDRQERLVKLESIEDITSLDPLDVPSRLYEFRALKDGWLEGEGSALSREGLEWLTTQFEQCYPSDLPLPYLYPTPEGSVRAEWSEGANAVVLETNLDSHSALWIYDPATVVSEGMLDPLNIALLAVVTAIGLGAALVAFQRRDITR